MTCDAGTNKFKSQFRFSSIAQIGKFTVVWHYVLDWYWLELLFLWRIINKELHLCNSLFIERLPALLKQYI